MVVFQCPAVPGNAGYKLVKLVHGAYSVHSLAERETFHPVIGPVAEAEALYVRQLGLVQRLANHAGEFVIWDVGLGAAANVLTVLRAAREISGSVRTAARKRAGVSWWLRMSARRADPKWPHFLPERQFKCAMGGTFGGFSYLVDPADVPQFAQATHGHV